MKSRTFMAGLAAIGLLLAGVIAFRLLFPTPPEHSRAETEADLSTLLGWTAQAAGIEGEPGRTGTVYCGSAFDPDGGVIISHDFVVDSVGADDSTTIANQVAEAWGSTPPPSLHRGTQVVNSPERRGDATVDGADYALTVTHDGDAVVIRAGSGCFSPR